MTTKAREFWIDEKKIGTTAWIAHTLKEHYVDGYIHVREVLSSEESELVELRRDRERLNWLLENETFVEEVNGKSFSVYCSDTRNIKVRETPRSAIDALTKENASLKNKINDFMSCCCSGCSKHNQNIIDQKFSEDHVLPPLASPELSPGQVPLVEEDVP